MDWATEIAAKVKASLEGGPYVADDVERIAVALRRVRLDEREACALIADRAPGNQEVGGENWTADYIARQIRARPTVI